MTPETEVALRAAKFYARAHAPWPWQLGLRARLEAAYVQGVLDAWAVTQQAQAAMATVNPVRFNTSPGEHP
jgi:hypothetical protein